jgi:dihydroxyacetone kinase-like protein
MDMKKLMNAVENVLTEASRGFGAAHSGIVSVNFDPVYVTRKGGPKQGKVALISGGGSGHEPMHAGFVGYGMLDAACPGQVFTSPTPDQMLAAAHAVDGGAGVLFIVKNYAGDVMNFEMASELSGGEIATVLTNDDVAVESSLHSQGRRGVAATVIVEKIVGAAAERGADLAACKALGERVNAASGTIGVALTSCTVPAAGKPTFEIGENELEMGVGIHGEPGRRRVAMMSADAIAAETVGAICEDIKPVAGQEVLLLVNGMGGTPLLELYGMYDAARRQCEARGLTIVRSLVGNYCTSL